MTSVRQPLTVIEMAMTVTCPLCQSGPGAACRAPSGRLAMVHRPRLAKAKGDDVEVAERKPAVPHIMMRGAATRSGVVIFKVLRERLTRYGWDVAVCATLDGKTGRLAVRLPAKEYENEAALRRSVEKAMKRGAL